MLIYQNKYICNKIVVSIIINIDNCKKTDFANRDSKNSVIKCTIKQLNAFGISTIIDIGLVAVNENF